MRTESGLGGQDAIPLSYLEIWWPGTELNRRRQPFQTINRPNYFFNQQLNSSRWPIYCDHSVTSADVRLSVGFAMSIYNARSCNRVLVHAEITLSIWT